MRAVQRKTIKIKDQRLMIYSRNVNGEKVRFILFCTVCIASANRERERYLIFKGKMKLNKIKLKRMPLKFKLD